MEKLTKAEIAIQKGYTADKFGNVYKPDGTPMRIKPNTNGYIAFWPWWEGNTHIIYVHSLIAHLKFGNYRPKYEVRHLNGIQTDNTWENIAIGTHSENIMDKTPEMRKAQAVYARSRQNKTQPTAATIANSRFSPSQILEIRTSKDTTFNLAKSHRVSINAINDIKSKRSYKWVSDE